MTCGAAARTGAGRTGAGRTGAGRGAAGGADVVRPFAGWLVRAEAAAEEVAVMSEVAVAARVAPRPVRPGAYEPMPRALYVYRQRTPHGEHSPNTVHTGVVCDIAPEAFLDGRVRGHESVQRDRVDGLARYLATVPQRVELVSTLHRAGPVVRATLRRAHGRPPVRDVTGPDGSRHTVWRVPEGPDTEELCRELGAATHYIADGHHRVAAGLEVWARSGRDSRRGVLCVAYPLDGLRLTSFERRVVGPVDPALVRTLLEAGFDVRPVTDAQGALTACPPDIAVRLDRRWYAARHRGVRPPGSPGLDVTLHHHRVLDRLPPGVAVEPTRATTAARVAACDADRAALFVLPPPELDTLLALADAGEVVPPKSTFFAPKPGSGIFLRDPAA